MNFQYFGTWQSLISLSSLVPEAIDHTDTAIAESASGIAALVHVSAQTAESSQPHYYDPFRL